MTDAFLSSGDNLDEFLEAYHEKRKLAHLRRVKVIIVSLYHEKRKLSHLRRVKVGSSIIISSFCRSIGTIS